MTLSILQTYFRPLWTSLTSLFLIFFLQQRLSPDCEDQIRVIIEESALDYRLDPQLQMHCSEEVGGSIFNLYFTLYRYFGIFLEALVCTAGTTAFLSQLLQCHKILLKLLYFMVVVRDCRK